MTSLNPVYHSILVLPTKMIIHAFTLQARLSLVNESVITRECLFNEAENYLIYLVCKNAHSTLKCFFFLFLTSYPTKLLTGGISESNSDESITFFLSMHNAFWKKEMFWHYRVSWQDLYLIRMDDSQAKRAFCVFQSNQ